MFILYGLKLSNWCFCSYPFLKQLRSQDCMELINLLVFVPVSDCCLQGEFVDDGTETHFTLGDHNCCVKAVSSGKRRDGIIHTLLVDGTEIAECTE